MGAAGKHRSACGRWSTSSPEQTRQAGCDLAQAMMPGSLRADVVLLRGEMGSGKTVLVQGMAEALGIEANSVQSPTYQLIHEHQGVTQRLVHVDLYRLDPEEVDTLGLDELLAEPGLVAIEWAERLPYSIPEAVEVAITRGAGDDREILVVRPGQDR